MTYTTKRGFTLIELLVVIAIIAILAALLFPVISAAKAKSLQASCANNMRQVTTALRSYADDWSNCLPGLNAFGDLVDGTSSISHPEVPLSGRGPLWSYIKTRQVFVCPAARLIHQESSAKSYKLNYTYTMNGYMTYAEENRSKANICGVNLIKSRNHTRTILLVDENCDESKNGGIIVNDALFIWQDRTCDRHPGSVPTPNVSGSKTIAPGVANVCYLDSHVGVVPALVEWNGADGKALFYR